MIGLVFDKKTTIKLIIFHLFGTLPCIKKTSNKQMDNKMNYCSGCYKGPFWWLFLLRSVWIPKSIISQLNQLELSFRRRKNNSCFCTDDMRDNLTGMIYPSMKPTRNISSIYTLCSNFNKFPYKSPVFQRKKTSQELRMLSRSLSDCNLLTVKVMIQVLQFVCYSKLWH